MYEVLFDSQIILYSKMFWTIMDRFACTSLPIFIHVYHCQYFDRNAFSILHNFCFPFLFFSYYFTIFVFLFCSSKCEMIACKPADLLIFYRLTCNCKQCHSHLHFTFRNLNSLFYHFVKCVQSDMFTFYADE